MGGKKGGGSSHTPVEAKETGRSFQIARMLEVISEGEIHGLVDDMCSVYLDKTPLQNKDGSFNFKNVSVYANSGTQNQDPLREFTSVEKEIDVNTKILKDKPIIKTVTDVNVNRIRMTLGVERLLRQEDNGDTNPTVVAMQIDVLKNNAVVESRTYEFNGKYSSAYREMFDLTVPKPPFSIRVTRIQEDSTTNKLQNGCFWSSYTEIIDKEFAYPNTALVGIKIDSEYFSNIPTRNYEIYGLMVKVPSNYDAFNHRYTSDFWDGSFKLSWTNNPAWIFYDLVTNTRYGMGQRLGEFGIDKWQLYAIGRYCDELVPDGFGGTEPRMTCNIWITDQRKAYELINDITSIFRAMPVWNGQALTAIQDRASDPVWTYNNANTIGGFTRQRSAKKARHNVIQVEYIDASDFYEKKVESVSDDALVARYGQNVKKVTAFGCTSRGQAYRTGRWILETEKLETETITFTVGQEGVMHLPYDVIEVADSQYAGMDIGGRVLAVNGTQVTLDRAIEVDNESYLSYVSQRGITENVKIVSFDKNTNIATVGKNLNGLPELTVWGLSTKRVSTGLYRAISIKENDNADGKTYTITALQHVPEKEDIVVNGTHFDPKPKSIYGDVVDAEITYNGSKLTVSGKINGSYNVLSSSQVVSYTVKLLKDGALVYIEKGLKSPDIKVDDLENGSYTAEISSYNAKNQLLQTYTKTFVINRPPLVTGIDIVGHLSSVILTWNFVDDTTQTEIWSSERDDINSAELVERITGMYYSHEIGAKKVRYYWLRHKRGVNVGNFDQIQGRKGESGTDLDAELEILNQKLSENIINDIIDTALPARKLGMTLYVDNLTDRNIYLGQNTVYDETANKQYTWNGTQYIPTEVELTASAIKGIIQPNQIATIPTTKLSGQLTDTQLQNISATKIIGTLTANQIANIPTTKLTGVLSANQITSNSLGVNIIQSQHLSTDSVTATKIQANSIGTNHIAVNSLNADRLLANTIEGAKIKAGAIATSHLQAGAISTDKLAVGLGGNLLQNPIFANPTNGVPYAWGKNVYANVRSIADNVNTTNTWVDQQVYLPNENLAQYIVDTTNSAVAINAKAIWLGQTDVSVIAGKTYIFSAYVSGHRLNANLYIDCRTKDNRYVLNRVSAYANGNMRGNIANTSRLFVKFTVPAEANRVDLYIMGYKLTAEGANNAMLFVARPMLEECTEHATEPSAWVNAGVTSIHGGSIVTRTITAQNIATGTLTANEIAGNTITGNKIAGRTITADKLVTKSITANEINVSTLSALSANLGSITAGTIKGTTITGNTISGGTISGTTISGGTISGTTINGGTIKGVRLEGATGRFTGELEVSQLIGGGIIEQITGKLKYVTSRRTYVGQNYGENSSSPIYETSYIYEATVTIKPAPTRRYVEIVGVKSFVVEANTSFSEKISKSFNSRSVGDQSLQFVVLAYTISTQKYISIS